jgi:MFS family permease
MLVSRSQDAQDNTATSTVPRAWATLVVLQFAYVISVVDRYVMPMLAAPVKHDLHLSDVQFSLLVGGPFAVFYGLAAIPFGWASDRFNRLRLIIIGVGFWSLCAGGSGLARNFLQLLCARLGLGMGEAALLPAGYSLLPDLFARRRVTLATALFSMSGMAGAAIAFIFGGLLLELFTSPGISTLAFEVGIRPWQLVFLAAGLLGVPWLISACFFSEPQRRASVSQAGQATTRSMMIHMRSNRGFYVLFLVGFTIASAIAYAIGGWGAVYLERILGFGSATAGTALGITVLIAALTGYPVIGTVTDFLFSKGWPDAPIRVFIISLIAGTPIMIAGFVIRNSAIFLCATFFSYALLAPFLVYAVTTIQIVTPEQFRGKMIALLVLCTQLFGYGLGPVVVALMTDHFFHDERRLGLALASTITLFVIISVTLLSLACRPLRRMLSATGAAAQSS